MIAGMALAGSQQMATADSNVRLARAWHLATFVVGAFGLAVQLWIAATHDLTYDGVVFSTHVRLWNVLSFFTIWSNILVTVVAYLLTREPRRAGGMFQVFRLASLVMITITGVIYALVLAPLWDPTGWQRVADQTLHYAVPVLAVVGYPLFGPRPRFSWEALWRSVLIPLTWVVYTLIRSPFISYSRDGETRHWYPYHFINVDDLGYGRVLLNMLGVFALLLAIGWVYLFLDRKLPAAPTR